MSANAAAVVIRREHVVGTDGDEAGVTDLHLAVKLHQTLGLAQIPRAESSATKHQDHGILPLQVRKVATFARVIGQLIIGKYRASYNVRSHKASSSEPTSEHQSAATVDVTVAILSLSFRNRFVSKTKSS